MSSDTRLNSYNADMHSRFSRLLIILVGLFSSMAGLESYAASDGAGAIDIEYYESRESEQFSKLNDLCREKFDIPISKAQEKKDSAAVVRLSKEASKEWESLNFISPWGKLHRRSKIVEYLMISAKQLHELGKDDKAALCYLECNVINEQDGLGNNAYMPFVAQAYVDNKQISKAEEIYKDLISKNHRASEMTIKLTALYELRGKQKLAETTLKHFLDSHPGDRLVLIYLKNFYVASKRSKDATDIESKLQDQHCPLCGSSDQVLPIVYGFPSVASMGNKKVHLGGCVESTGSQRWWCQKDKTGF